eukprot:2704778-Alexandrium_andersonii.AAC.1
MGTIAKLLSPSKTLKRYSWRWDAAAYMKELPWSPSKTTKRPGGWSFSCAVSSRCFSGSSGSESRPAWPGVCSGVTQWARLHP